MKSLILLAALALPMAANAEEGVVSFGELISRMSDGGKRQFIYQDAIGERFAQRPVHSNAEALEGPNAYAAGLEILKTAGMAAVVQESGAIRIVLTEAASKEALRVISSLEELPATDEFCSLAITPHFVRVRDLLPAVQALISDPRNVVCTETTNAMIISDFASNLRKVARIVQKIDVGQDSSTWRITVAVLEGRPGTAAAPDGFDAKALHDATGRSAFTLLGDGMATLAMGGTLSDKGGRGQAMVRLWGGEKLAATLRTTISPEGSLMVEELMIAAEAEEGKSSTTLLQTRLGVKNGAWVVAGSLPAADRDGAVRVVMVKTEPVK